ncbi:NADH:flavin oxidoreductase/NADH oxidase [soil metagenome]
MSTSSPLFSPFRLRGVELSNRIVASPMWQYVGERGHPTDWHLMNLGRLAEGGVGLVIQEGTLIERRGCGTLGDIGIWDDAFVPGLTRLCSVIRANGSVPGIQIMHAGRKARQKSPFEGRGPLEPERIDDEAAWELIAPSAIAVADGYPVPRAMTLADIETVQRAWVDAARRADQAGHEVLNIHGGHGYLIAQFLSELSNLRDDAYGGSTTARMRFVIEAIEGIRTVWPDHKPIMMRLSVVDNGWTLDDSVTLVKQLQKAGVDMIDCSSGGITGSPLTAGAKAFQGYQVPYAAHLRAETGMPTMAVGLIVQPAYAEQIVKDGSADLVAIARELIYNPNWPIDAAQKLGVDPTFTAARDRARFWLERRAASVPGLKPSTFG